MYLLRDRGPSGAATPPRHERDKHQLFGTNNTFEFALCMNVDFDASAWVVGVEPAPTGTVDRADAANLALLGTTFAQR
jgi:hypothetical protein